MRAFSKLLAAGLLSLAAACGGPSDSPPTPLARHFDDMFIADIPLDQKQSVVQTQNDWSVAKMENAKAEADLNETTAQLQVVRNDHKAAKLGIDSALSNKKQAEASADNNRINQATKELHAAESRTKAAEQRVKYYEAYREWLKRHHRLTQENMYWREAQYELAKSQLAQQNNKAPRGVDYNWFPKQETERAARAEKAKLKAEELKQKAMNARELWLKQQEIADRESGRASGLPDPMAPRAQPAGKGTLGGTAAPKAPAPAPAPAPTPAPAPAPAATPAAAGTTPAAAGGTPAPAPAAPAPAQ